MAQADVMCVHKRRHGACMCAVCRIGWLIGAHRGEGAAQILGEYHRHGLQLARCVSKHVSAAVF
jgi:hypothetical protein